MSKEKNFEFEAKTSQILSLLTHSVYSNTESFVRELLSNSADALDKAKLDSIQNSDKYEWDMDFKIWIDIDKENKMISITDNGIGMKENELKTNLWTIAKSGTKEFLEKIKQAKESQQQNMIGQFGIGFYSVFMIAKKVEVESKSPYSEKSYIWISDWNSWYQIKEWTKKSRWTQVKVYVWKDYEFFLEEEKIKSLVQKYSDYLPYPIMMKESYDQNNPEKIREYQQVNQQKSIWTKNKSEVSKEEYEEFYKNLTMDFNPPLDCLHLDIEGKVNYKALMYIPQKQWYFFDPQNSEFGPKLYVQNVMVLENCKELLPSWLRFVKGVVETNDLPLNISREILQKNKVSEIIRAGIVQKVLDNLKYLLKNQAQDYQDFFENFGMILKEGVYTDMENKEKISEVILFDSLLENKKISFDEYLEKTGKNEIYYISGKSKTEVLNSPYLEYFKDKGIDVLLMYDPIDEFVVSSLWEYKWKPIKSISSSETEVEDENNEKKDEKKEEENKGFIDYVKTKIGEDVVEEVKFSNKLKSSIGALATKQWWISPQMEKIMKAMWQEAPSQKRIFELNPESDLVKDMIQEYQSNKDSEKLNELIDYVYQQAVLAEGWEIENIQDFIQKTNKFAQSYLS